MQIGEHTRSQAFLTYKYVQYCTELVPEQQARILFQRAMNKPENQTCPISCLSFLTFVINSGLRIFLGAQGLPKSRAKSSQKNR